MDNGEFVTKGILALRKGLRGHVEERMAIHEMTPRLTPKHFGGMIHFCFQILRGVNL
jgi:hypothetical protein